MWGAHWLIGLEKRNIPTVYIVDQPFEADVQITCDKEGMSRLRRVVVSHPCGTVPDEQFPAIMHQLVSMLTHPLSRDEQFPPPRPLQKTPKMVFEGSLEEVDRFFYKRGWTDGLPIFPPTEEVVREMLKGTSHSPDEVVTSTMMPESLTVTVEKVAVVGAMTGCEPQYMPVLLSIVEAFGNDRFSSSVRSTSSFAFPIIVNGPVTKKIGMNVGINALGSGTGNKANARIGRFLRLAIICLGGSRSGLNDLSTLGSPSKYSFCFAENEERSPWEPFHVSSGYDREESVVTVLSGGWNHNSPFSHNDLNEISRAIIAYEYPTGVLVIMDPMAARRVSAQGYTKQEAEEHIWSMATKTVAQFKGDFHYPAFIEPVLQGRHGTEDRPTWPAHYLELPPEALVQAFPRKYVRIVVVGGETNPITQVWQMTRSLSVAVDRWN